MTFRGSKMDPKEDWISNHPCLLWIHLESWSPDHSSCFARRAITKTLQFRYNTVTLRRKSSLQKRWNSSVFMNRHFLRSRQRMMVFSLLLFTHLQTALASKEPQAQDDLYIWKAPYLPHTLERFQYVKRYRFTHQTASQQLHERVQKAKEKDFGTECGNNAPRDWPISRYDLGHDGQLLVVSCISQSLDSWSVYYHLTRDDQLKPISVQFPILSVEGSDPKSSHPKIISFQKQYLLKNSEILQRRVVSQYREESRHYRAEWVWKEGHGLTLIEYMFISYDEENQPTEHSLYPAGAK